MKKIVFSLLLITIISVITNAQSKQEKAVMVAVEQLRKGMIDADKAILEKLVTDKLSYGHSGGHIDDKKEFVEKIVSGKSDFVSIDLSEQTVSVSGTTAVVRHILKAKTNDGGKPADVHLRVLLIWQKQGGHWKLLARQAVKMT
ncbi:MAG: nuclear transport factor 2 family protein [Chitinophagaceae bacterium]|jgi:ketosteroid isomerase-like protein|nr:nuclear transport factor 2 family protein [Chitinophagaceae bacterium]MBK7680761.1 nuclear transport factor 2 family protein [Chitinophagaceae bacterium]MBK8300995.1 nuclear transport factor 2 family protein [Chitinophagaceae bacterium]MBK9660315.1 nuclear transport factor 2 family protein [Chitinophagaceae bacterium]MBK9938354.1 nuclear transport factor 2 family protein [Chitinophagaceae bacterium]